MESFVEWGYLGLFIASFLAATVIPLSSEIVLSILIANNYDLTLSLFVASLGSWMGGLSSYGLGRLGKWNIIEKYFKVKKEKITNWKNYIDNWGSTLAFLCWLPIIGDPIAVGLGFFRTHFYLVSLWMFVGKALRYIVWALITYWGLSLF
ncbi:MAG: membrane protein YqaA with SNARE-associated domain [Candidatus Marivariicella framensis]|jgi:membrane protein YqaA with SNARE-associated domain|tara:strand:+ start:1086 stop:1535 length:450 start_codon:yes stop_codon:yes gene_type:complete